MESLVGLVGEMPLRTCMLYRSFTWVSALISLVLAESRDTIRFSYNTPTMALFRLHGGRHFLYWIIQHGTHGAPQTNGTSLPLSAHWLGSAPPPLNLSFSFLHNRTYYQQYIEVLLGCLMKMTPWVKLPLCSKCFCKNWNMDIRWQRKKHQRFHFTEEKCTWSMGSPPKEGIIVPSEKNSHCSN